MDINRVATFLRVGSAPKDQRSRSGRRLLVANKEALQDGRRHTTIDLEMLACQLSE